MVTPFKGEEKPVWRSYASLTQTEIRQILASYKDNVLQWVQENDKNVRMSMIPNNDCFRLTSLLC